MWKIFLLGLFVATAARAELTVGETSESGKDAPIVATDYKKSMKFGGMCVTAVTAPINEKMAILTCPKKKKEVLGTECFCKDTLRKTGKNIAGKMTIGTVIQKQVAAAGIMPAGLMGSSCHLMGKWMGSKGETAWYCANDAFTPYPSFATCNAVCKGL